jgi:hypothetical protein
MISNTSNGRAKSLATAFPECVEYFEDACGFAATKPAISLFRSRQILEAVVEKAYVQLTGQLVPDRSTILKLLDDPVFEVHVRPEIIQAMRDLRRTGNRAVHREHVTTADASRSLQCLEQVLSWAIPAAGLDGGTEARTAMRPQQRTDFTGRQSSSTETVAAPIGGVILVSLGGIVAVLIAALVGAGIALLICLMFAYRTLLTATSSTINSIIIIGAVAGIAAGFLVAIRLMRQ